jgi:hypothetical protein
MLPIGFAIILAGDAIGGPTINTYEGIVFPENVGWERIVFTEIDRTVADGWFVQYVDFANEVDSYRLPLAHFVGVPTFFLEWRVESDAPSSILDFSGTPVAVSAAGMSSAIYHFTITDSRVQVLRGNFFPIHLVDIEPGVPHTYRVEVCGPPTCDDDRYIWYIDGIFGDSGIGRGPYPTEDSFLIWGTRRQMFDSTTRWDYVRFGVIPQDASGDFDSSGTVGLFDFYFFHECLTNERIGINGGPDNDAGPGCRWADFDGDTDVDIFDFLHFQAAFTGPEQ